LFLDAKVSLHSFYSKVSLGGYSRALLGTRLERKGDTRGNKKGSYLGNRLPLSYPIAGALPRLPHPPQSGQAPHRKDEP
jgi:hypothetical protein